MFESLIRNLQDATDILKRARNAAELAKGVLPNHWLKRHVLNADHAAPAHGASAAHAVTELRTLRNRLKGEVIDAAGQVDYGALAKSDTYQRLIETSALLKAVDLGSIVTDAERIAFWTNLYNVLSIHGVLALGIRESVMEIPSFFGTVSYQVGGHILSLDEIENGVLRRNAPHPATGTRLFSEGDPRADLSPSVVDPRIHAALVCASTSCPPVAFYDADRLDTQFDLATGGYVAADVRVDDSERRVTIPITFRYYQSDFGGAGGVWRFLAQHSQGDQHDALARAEAEGYVVQYHRYDWSLNSVV